MSRYMERAENTARMLNVSYETSLLPQSAAAAEAGWEGILSISELLPSYLALYKTITPRHVMAFMVKDENNPSSIISCLRAARENARAVRGTLTTEVWETQNQTWLEVNRMLKSGEFERDPGQFFEWVKFRSHLSRGVTVGTMSLCLDDPQLGLPADENFRDKLDLLRTGQRRLCEPSRLAIDKGVSKRVFAALIHISYIYAHNIHGFTDYVIEVNPRAARTVPFVSKCIGVSLAMIAARVMA
eukprot:gene44800-59800_t